MHSRMHHFPRMRVLFNRDCVLSMLSLFMALVHAFCDCVFTQATSCLTSEERAHCLHQRRWDSGHGAPGSFQRGGSSVASVHVRGCCSAELHRGYAWRRFVSNSESRMGTVCGDVSVSSATVIAAANGCGAAHAAISRTATTATHALVLAAACHCCN